MKGTKSVRWNTLQITAVGFLGVIFLGGILLYLPVSNTQPIAFIDALFTSVTSVCVTGLVTIVPASQFTLFGKVVLLILIQIGGLGVIACATKEDHGPGESSPTGSLWRTAVGRNCQDGEEGDPGNAHSGGRRGIAVYAAVRSGIWRNQGHMVFGFPFSLGVL